MTAADDIRSHARVLNLRLRLGLVDLPVIERWADQAILTDKGVHTELADLCLAGKKGIKHTQALLALLGGAPSSGRHQKWPMPCSGHGASTRVALVPRRRNGVLPPTAHA